jgi:hypothetical protein
MSGAIYSSEVSKRIGSIAGYSLDVSSADAALSIDVPALKNITPPELKAQVLYVLTDGIRWVWIVCTPVAVVGLIGQLFLRVYTLQRQVHRQGNLKDDEAKVEVDPTATSDPVPGGTASSSPEPALSERKDSEGTLVEGMKPELDSSKNSDEGVTSKA